MWFLLSQQFSHQKWGWVEPSFWLLPQRQLLPLPNCFSRIFLGGTGCLRPNSFCICPISQVFLPTVHIHKVFFPLTTLTHSTLPPNSIKNRHNVIVLLRFCFFSQYSLAAHLILKLAAVIFFWKNYEEMPEMVLSTGVAIARAQSGTSQSQCGSPRNVHIQWDTRMCNEEKWKTHTP